MSCVVDATCFYTAGSLLATKWSGLPIIVLVVLFFQNLYFGVGVGMARKKYGVAYPFLYATPGVVHSPPPTRTAADGEKSAALHPSPQAISPEDAYAFNCVQRGHQNHLEQLPLVIPLLLVNWFTFPLVGGFAALLWCAGRHMYFIGYSRNVNARMWGAFGYIGLLTMLCLNITAGVYLFQGKQPY